MTGLLVSGYDIDTDHMADVFEAMANDLRRDKIHVTAVSDSIDAEAEDVCEYTFELSFFVTDSALMMDYVNGRLVETNME
jgi:hypothetical protein